MKLLYCQKCKDVVKLHQEARVCLCGASGGWAASMGSQAMVTGEAKVLAFNATDLRDAVWDSEAHARSANFHACVIPEHFTSVVRVP
jgi:hypothetical protein